MKTNKISIAMFVVLLSVLVFASNAFSAAPVKEPKEPPLEKEHKFSKLKRNIEMYDDGHLIKTDNELIFLDDQGNIIKKKPVPPGLAKMSRDGKLFGFVKELTPGASLDDRSRKTRFTMTDADGNKLWEADNIGTRFIEAVLPGNGGTLLESDCAEGGCYVQIMMSNKDKTGVIINPRFDPKIQSGGIMISKDGNYFVEWYGRELNSLALFDVNGNELWDKTIENYQIRSISISSKGNFIVADVLNKLEAKEYIYI